MAKIIDVYSGIILCFLIAIFAWLLGLTFPIIGGPVFGILLGIIVMTIFPNLQSISIFESKLENGIKYTSKKLLQFSIILLGFEMNLFNVIKVGGQSLFVMIFTLSTSFIVAFFVGKALKVKGNLSVLIGVGTSICGGSAIAAVSPIIEADNDDVSHAISTIFLFNILAVFLFPAIGHFLNMSDNGFGMWAGTAINDTSSVVAAASSWSVAAGNNTALGFATVVKLTRTLMIIPICLFLAIYTSSKNKNKDKKSSFSFSKIFPWFVIGFIAAAILNTFANIPLSISHGLGTIGHFVIVMAMVAIGLNTNLKKLISNGFKPIFLGVCCWFSVAIVSLIVQIIIKVY